jgi:hypothetical protein
VFECREKVNTGRERRINLQVEPRPRFKVEVLGMNDNNDAGIFEGGVGW